MGLTIHYSFKSDTKSVKEIKRIIKQVHQRALDLPFHSVTDIVDLKEIGRAHV